VRTVVKDGLKWCSVHEAGRYLKKSPTYIRLLTGEGSLASVRIEPGGDLYVSVADLTSQPRTKYSN